MAQKTKKETENTTSEAVVEKTCPCGCKSKMKASTVLVGVLAVGAIAVWALAANNWLKIPGISSLMGQKDGQVVATVDGEPVYMSEVQELVAQVPQLEELPFEVIYPQLVKDIVAEKVLKKAVAGSDIEKNPLVQHRINSILFEAYLVDKFSKTITDEELKKIHLEEIKNFPRQEEVRARHIVVKTEQEAKDILVQLKAGADFKMLADAKSLETDREGGDLGYFRKDSMIPAFSNPVFELKTGQLSAPIKTPFGWHIVLVEDRRLAAPPSFEEMREFLRKQVFQQKVGDLIAGEHARFNAEILVPSLKTEEPVVTVEEEADQALEPEETKATEKAVAEPAEEEAVAEEPAQETPAEEVSETKEAPATEASETKETEPVKEK